MASPYYLINSDGSKKILLPNKQQNKLTIGRTPQNNLQILDTTVSKDHAIIYFFASQKKYVLEDLGSINGTFINGKQLLNSKIYLKHNDQIQFGKCQQKYFFKIPNPDPQKKGKINFKDYHFQLQQEISSKPVLQNKKQNRIDLIPENGNTKTSWNQSKIPDQNENSQKKSKQRFERAIKIPKFEQFLELEGQDFSDQIEKRSQQKIQSNSNLEQPPKKWTKTKESDIKKGAVKLPELNRVQLNEEDKINRMMFQRKKQLQKAQKQALLRKTQQQQKMLEQRLKLQIEQANQQEQRLRKKYEIQRIAESEQKRMIKQKQLLQKKIQLQQKQLKQKGELQAQDFRQKQENLMNEMMKARQMEMLKLRQKQEQLKNRFQAQKQKQVKQIKQTQVKKREQKEEQIKKQVQSRRKQLQFEAQALTKQYENIYKQTIKKIKLSIEAQQEKALQLQDTIQKTQTQIYQLNSAVKSQEQQHSQLKQQYLDIHGRNKAFLLYASHLQDKIDKLRLQAKSKSIKDPSKPSLQLKDSIIQSRKLLNMKINQHKQVQNQIKQSFLKLNIHSPQSQQFLTTILQNYQEIQRLKQIYFEFLQEEKVIQNKWDLQLEQNNILEQKTRNSKKQIQGNKKKLAQNLNENLKKITQQRLHMLKIMYYAPQQKKNAAKFLIEEMLNIEQQNKAIILDSQNTHTSITNIILQIQQTKRQNQNLSDLLFGADSTSHHFDNMKVQINRLMEAIQNQRDGSRVAVLSKISEQTRDIQNKLYLETRREKKIKDQLKNNGYAVPALNTQKNPLVFFGKLLTKKQSEVQSTQQQERQLSKQIQLIRNKVSALSEQKTKMNKLLQDYKQRQLKNARDLLK